MGTAATKTMDESVTEVLVVEMQGVWSFKLKHLEKHSVIGLTVMFKTRRKAAVAYLNLPAE